MLINEKGKVMQILGKDKQDQENSPIGVFVKNGNEEQLFDMVYADEMPAELKKGDMNEDFGMLVDTPFQVITQLPSGRYLDLVGRNMVIKTRNGLTSQEWFFDQNTRTIKSMKNKAWSWDVQSAGKSNNMQVYNTNSRWFQLFRWDKDEG
jgi:hypothetical protein